MLDKKIEIIDNFLPLDEFKKIQEAVVSQYFPWYLNTNVIDLPEERDHLYNYQLVHTFYKEWRPFSDHIHHLDDLVKKINPLAIIRMKANLNPVTEKRIIHGMHIDYLEPCKTGIFYINTNNGITVFDDGTEVESVENRFVNFDSRLFHSGSTCTDTKTRFVININYIQRINQDESRDF
jgi:hypothetical protein